MKFDRLKPWLFFGSMLAVLGLLVVDRAGATGSFYAETRYGTRWIGQSALSNLKNCTSGNQCTYVDTASTPVLHYYDGTNDNTLTVAVAGAKDVASTGASTTLVTYASPVSGVYTIRIVVSAHTNSDTVSATIAYTDATEGFATTLTPISSVALTHDSNTGTTSSSTTIRASAATSIVVTLSVTSQTTTKASALIERQPL